MPKKDKKEVGVEQKPTEFKPTLTLPDGTQVTLEEYLAWLGNQILDIKKAVE